MLQRRELNLSTTSLIAPILKRDQSIRERVRGASHRKVEQIVAQYGPPVALRDRVRPVRVATAGAGSEDKLFVQFLADENLMELFEEVRALLSRDGRNPSMADVMRAALTEYRDRHSPTARKERRDARASAATVASAASLASVAGAASVASTASVDSRRRESKDATQSRHIPEEIRDAVF